MIEPLIVVEGNLRLPAVRPLADPLLNFVFEWSPARTRPVQSQSEVALYAARFTTAYVPAFHLSDTSSPYRAVNLWGVFAKEEIRHAALALIQREPAEGHVDKPRVDPIPLTVGVPLNLAAGKLRVGKAVLGGVTAAAGALFILWLLFGYHPEPSGGKPLAPAVDAAMRASPAPGTHPAAPAPASMTIAIAGTAPTVLAASAVAPVSNVAPPKPLAEASRAGTHTKPAIESQSHVKQTVRAEPSKKVARKRSSPGAQSIPDAPVQRHASRTKAERTPPTVRTTNRPRDADEHIAAIESAWRTRAASGHVETIQPPRAQNDLSPEALYAILQHSPTLDSNLSASGAGRSRAGSASAN
jgi:hypothetical protein